MILTYQSGMAGPYHIEKGIPCQDSFAVRKGQGPFWIASAADGLGSEKHSDIGSSIAARTSAEDCAEQIAPEMSAEEIREVMKKAMCHAYRAVLERAEEEGNSKDEYDTTLCLAAYDGEHLYYAQSGDSGIVVLFQDGTYASVTTQQRDEDGCVYPLCFGPAMWEFGHTDRPVSAVMLMTDGVYEQICPPLLKYREVSINVPLAEKFMNRFDCTEESISDLEEKVSQYLANYPQEALNDDKTVVVLINTGRVPERREDSYYEIPDWEAIREEIKVRYAKSTDPETETAEAEIEEAAEAGETEGKTEAELKNAAKSESERQEESRIRIFPESVKSRRFIRRLKWYFRHYLTRIGVYGAYTLILVFLLGVLVGAVLF